jgi:hypothetical protein
VNRPENRKGFGQHLLNGYGLLWARWAAPAWAWTTQGTKRGDTTIRRGILAAGALLLATLVRSSWPLLIGLALAVTIAALRTATKAARKPAAPAADEGPAANVQEDVDEQLPDVPPALFLTTVHEVIGTARGVHLATLARALSGKYGGAWEIADVRALCEAAGQPTRPTVRAPGAGPTVGIHRADLLPLPHDRGQGPAVGVVVAGQTATTGATTSGPTTAATATVSVIGDERIAIAPDPDNPHRHTVTVTPITRRRRA